MIIDERIDIDKLGIALLGITKVRTEERGLKVIEVIGQPSGMSRRDVTFLRLLVSELIAAFCFEPAFTWIETILLEDVATRDSRFCRVFRLKLLDVHAVLAALDLLH